MSEFQAYDKGQNMLICSRVLDHFLQLQYEYKKVIIYRCHLYVCNLQS